MGVYRDHVVPRLVDVACGVAGFDRWRARAAEGLAGRGRGGRIRLGPQRASLPARGRRRAGGGTDSGGPAAVRAAGSGAARVPVEHVGLDGQELPLGGRSRVTRCSSRSPCARCLTPPLPSPRFIGCCDPAARSTSWSTGCPRPPRRRLATAHRTAAAPAGRRLPPDPGRVVPGGGSRVRHAAQRATLRPRAKALVLAHRRRRR